MSDELELSEKLIRSRQRLAPAVRPPLRKEEAEGGCGVIGIACSEKIAGRHLLQSLTQMRNRGNGKGGGIAAVGLAAEELRVTRNILEDDYLLGVAYLDPSARSEVERTSIVPTFEVDSVFQVPHLDSVQSLPTLEVRPPEVVLYFVRLRANAIDEFGKQNGLDLSTGSEALLSHIEDEIVYQNSFRLNRAFYASEGEKRAFVLSHAKNLLVLKMVGYGDDVVRYYQLENFHAHVWIGHHRYPTKGRVWHPGGAHPFAGLHEALVHNGDFANYASICEHLAQRNIQPLFLTDTEVSVLVFDLLHRTYGYPLEYVFEALAPTTERDFTLLSEEKQRIYRQLQTTHIHGSPDGPWFFLVAHSDPAERAYRLIGITDTSMLRPQVFALQQGNVSIGFAASEKQAIDAALESLSREDARFWSRADLYWNARGGSHTDGGAFVFRVQPPQAKDGPAGVEDNCNVSAEFTCTDKFGRCIQANRAKVPFHNNGASTSAVASPPDVSGQELFAWGKDRMCAWMLDALLQFLRGLEHSASSDENRRRAFEVLTLLMDRRYPTGRMRRSCLLSALDQSLGNVVDSIRRSPSKAFAVVTADDDLSGAVPDCETLVLDAVGFAPEGERSLARAIVRLYQQGHRRFAIARAKGQRFIANGLGADTSGLRIDVYGSSGDYLASGIDGAEVVVHGSAQDQVAQIMKGGKLCIYGDVGQTFLYAAKGGEAFVLGNAAGRPLINAVGRPRVVINGTCLDYLAESCMAGDPLDGGGFVVVNGVAFDDDGGLFELDTPYPGGNLFSLSSGGAIYLRDPHGKVSEDQLNGGEFAPMQAADWALIRPYLEENGRLFGIPLHELLQVNGQALSGEQVYRKVQPHALQALQAEEAWVKMHS